MGKAACSIALPSRFRPNDILAFHRRDAEEVAERVTTTGLEKGLAVDGRPAVLRVTFAGRQAEAELAIDGRIRSRDEAFLDQIVGHMLGLTQRVDVFEKEYGAHPVIGDLVMHNRGLRVPQTATPFEALAWAITGQQISVKAAVSVRRRLIRACGVAHSSGLLCFPDAGGVAATPMDALREAGLSQAKAMGLKGLSEAVLSGAVDLSPDGDVEVLRGNLLAIKGIGPWTISYALLRGFAWLDGSLHGDVAVRKNLGRLLRSEDKITAAETEAWLAPFSPWRALVAAHLWAMPK